MKICSIGVLNDFIDYLMHYRSTKIVSAIFYKRKENKTNGLIIFPKGKLELCLKNYISVFPITDNNINITL